jgi:dihydroneopterin aldolase
MAGVLSYRDWSASLAYPTDKVIVQNLSTTANAGVDVWGRKKKQPVLISTTLHLTRPFDSAALDDKVDQSTVHYGVLSKNILSLVEKSAEEWMSSDALALGIKKAIEQTVSSAELLAGLEIQIFYPKGSMLGEGAEFSYCEALATGQTSQRLHLKNVRIPCIIGVNSHERLQKQAVVVNLWVDCVRDPEGYTKAEAIMTKVFSARIRSRGRS